MCAFTWESAPVPWLFTTNTTLIHYFDFKSKHCCFKCFYPGKKQNPGVKVFGRDSPGKIRVSGAKYQVFGGKPWTSQHCSMPNWCFLWRLLRCVWLEAALQDRSVCVITTYLNTQQQSHLCFLSLYFDVIHQSVFKSNTPLYSRMSRV